MQQVNKYNRDYLTFLDDYGRTPAFQIGLYATSGHGKGMAEEGFIEDWKKTTGGVVIVLADPKDECEFGFVNFKPKERYHLNSLRSDGIEPTNYSCKLYHPFSFNIPKYYVPEITFFTFPLSGLKREDWSILAETKSDSPTIRLLSRASSELKKNEGLFMFLQNCEKMSESLKNKKKAVEDPKNFYLRKPSGNAKSITEISSMLHSFRNNYFLSNLNCKYNLDYESILLDSENYHVFLSMWLGDLKLKEFCVLHLLNSFISEIQRLSNKQVLKKPVLFVIPEIRKLCPVRPDGYKEFLSESIGDALNTIRSVGRGISLIYDSQSWSGTDERVRNSGETFFGRLGTKDKEFVCKALSYNKDNKEKIGDCSRYHCAFLRFEHEDDGIYRFFLPSHRHKEENYNWIETYQKEKMPMKIYEDIKKEMREEYDREEQEIKDIIKKRRDRESQEEEEKKKIKEEKESKKEVKKENVIAQITPEMARRFFKMWKIDKMSLRSIEKELKNDPLIQVKPSIGTIRKHACDFEDKLNAQELPFGKFEYGKVDLGSMIGEGVMKEEVLE